MSKEKQQVNLTSIMPPEDAYDDEGLDVDYLVGLTKKREAAKEEIPPVSPKLQQEERERQQKLKELYPDFLERDIPLEKLVGAPAEWNFFPQWNREQMTELMENIAVYGQLSPALVWEQEDGTYMILGGHNRFHALSKLHEILAASDPEEAKFYETMRCNVYAHDTLDEVEARKIIIFDNTIRRENSKSLMARSIINMNQLMKETRDTRRPDTRRTRIRDQIAETMNVSSRTVTGVIRLRNLIPEFWPLFDAKDKEQKISAAFGQAISWLPENLQRYIYESKIYVGARLSSAQAKALRSAETEAQVREIFEAVPEKKTVVKVQLSYAVPVPDGMEPLILPCRREERSALAEALKNASLSEETKQVMAAWLKAQPQQE